MRPSEVPQEWVEAGGDALHSLRMVSSDERYSGDPALSERHARFVLAALIPRIRAAALRDHAADAYTIDRTAPEAVNAWLLRAARQEEQK